jgi:hypothetical protein
MKKQLVALSAAFQILLCTGAANAQLPKTADEYIAFARKLEPVMTQAKDAAASFMKKAVPDPAAYEKSLPAKDIIESSKDAANLKNYGGLSEAYLYNNGDVKKAEELFSWFNSLAPKILPKADNYRACVEGDFGIYYFTSGQYAKAEAYLVDEIKELETKRTAASANNLISGYICMALIRDKAGKTKEAADYAKKYVDLALSMQQPSSPPPPADTKGK